MGEWLTLRVTLTGRSDTPVDEVRLCYRTVETRLTRRGVLRAGNQLRHCRFERALSSPGFQLGRAEQRQLTFEVQLPPDLPPTWSSDLSSVEHEVEVRVVIPRWLDRTALFDLQVVPAPTEKERRPALFSSAPAGPRGTELNLELALESSAVALGGALRGAVAMMNTEHHPVRRVEVSLVVRDAPVRPSRLDAVELFRSEPTVLTTEPAEGRSYPFALQVPSALPTSFSGTLVSLEWLLEARAVVRLGRDLVLAPPVEVFTSNREREPGPFPSLRVAPLGNERRALVWARVAARCGLEVAGEKLSCRRGAVALEFTVELRGNRLHGVATLRWPAAGLGVRVSERRWSDALATSAPTGDARFDERFVVQGRDAAQVRALLSDAVRGALLAFERVTFDDRGAQLASPGNGTTDEELEPRVRAAVTAADALDAALRTVPAPAPLEPHRAAWAAHAERLGGTFCAGDFSIRGARYREHEVELLTCFDDEGHPTHTLARALVAAPTSPLSEAAQRAFASVAAECPGLLRTDTGLEARLPSPLAEPQRAESVWRALQRLASVR